MNDYTKILTVAGAVFLEELPEEELREMANVEKEKHGRNKYRVSFPIGIDSGQKQYLRESIINTCIREGLGTVRVTDQSVSVWFSYGEG